MRLSEPLTLQKLDLLRPQPGISKHWLCLVFREERESRSKVYASDEPVEMTSKLAPYLAELCDILKEGQPKDYIFPFSYVELLGEFRKAARTLGVQAVPYQARHSGASLDAALGHRSRLEIKARGRWSSDRSIIRYESKARVVESLDQIPKPMIAYMKECECRLGDLLCGRVSARSLRRP